MRSRERHENGGGCKRILHIHTYTNVYMCKLLYITTTIDIFSCPFLLYTPFIVNYVFTFSFSHLSHTCNGIQPIALTLYVYVNVCASSSSRRRRRRWRNRISLFFSVHSHNSLDS